MQLNIENEVKFKNSKEYSIDDSFVVSKFIKSGMDEKDYKPNRGMFLSKTRMYQMV